MQKLPFSRLKDYFKADGLRLSRRERISILGLTMLYLFFFLLFFQPFGVNNYDPSEEIRLQFVLALAVFIFSAGLVLLLNDLLLYNLFDPKKRLALYGWILWNYFLLTTTCFLVYNFLGGWHDFRWSSYGEFFINFVALSVVPVAGIFVYLSIRRLQESLTASYRYKHTGKDGEEMVRILAENKKDAFVIRLHQLVYLESADNYVDIHYLENNELKKTILRQSLKNISEQINHPSVFRCHRSCIINLIHLERVQGNRNKLFIYLAHTRQKIPVGRSYIDTLFELIE